MATYRMDDATLEHLIAWCDRNTVEDYTGDDHARELRDAIVTHLEAQDAEDSEYELAHGWQHIRDLL